MFGSGEAAFGAFADLGASMGGTNPFGEPQPQVTSSNGGGWGGVGGGGGASSFNPFGTPTGADAHNFSSTAWEGAPAPVSGSGAERAAQASAAGPHDYVDPFKGLGHSPVAVRREGGADHVGWAGNLMGGSGPAASSGVSHGGGGSNGPGGNLMGGNPSLAPGGMGMGMGGVGGFGGGGGAVGDGANGGLMGGSWMGGSFMGDSVGGNPSFGGGGMGGGGMGGGQIGGGQMMGNVAAPGMMSGVAHMGGPSSAQTMGNLAGGGGMGGGAMGSGGGMWGMGMAMAAGQGLRQQGMMQVRHAFSKVNALVCSPRTITLMLNPCGGCSSTT
jgi:hypothetical protein